MFNRSARAIFLTVMSVGLGIGYGCGKADDSASHPTTQEPAAKQTAATLAVASPPKQPEAKTAPVPPANKTTQAENPKSVVRSVEKPTVAAPAKPTPVKRKDIAGLEEAAVAPKKTPAKPRRSIPGLGLHLTTVAEQQVNDAAADLLAKWEKIQSLSAIMRTDLHQEKTDTRRQQNRDAAGRFSVKKKDGVTLVKFVELRRSQVERAEDDWVVMGQRITNVNDGKYAYILDELPKTVTAVKYNLPLRILHIGGPELFRDIRSFYNVTLKDDEVIEGNTARVFEVARRGGNFTGRYFIDAETGILLKREIENQRDRYTRTTLVSEVVIGAAFSEDHFKLVVPDGVELEDKTK